jgi:hypothetical protein
MKGPIRWRARATADIRRSGNLTALGSGDNASFLATSGACGAISAPIRQSGIVMEHPAPTQNVFSPVGLGGIFLFPRCLPGARSPERSTSEPMVRRPEADDQAWPERRFVSPTDRERREELKTALGVIGVVWRCFGTATTSDRAGSSPGGAGGGDRGDRARAAAQRLQRGSRTLGIGRQAG